MRILVGSPVRQKPQVLEQFLKGLDDVDKSGVVVSYFFVDDNIDEKSTKLLKDFANSHDMVYKKGSELVELNQFSRYESNEITHYWDTSTIRKIAYFKDTIIEFAIKEQYDYLFFIDSDIVLDHRTLHQLISDKVEIVSNVFWTQWKPNWNLEPQCFWIPDLGRRDESPFSQKQMDNNVARQMKKEFFDKMRVPGLYKVEGLGACTLIARSALEKGVRFKEIPNLGLMGEDRHFCIRAGVLDIELYYDTTYPVYHIYREEYLDRVEEYKKEGFKFDMCQTFFEEPEIKTSTMDEFKRITKKVFMYVRRIVVRKLNSSKAKNK